MMEATIWAKTKIHTQHPTLLLISHHPATLFFQVAPFLKTPFSPYLFNMVCQADGGDIVPGCTVQSVMTALSRKATQLR